MKLRIPWGTHRYLRWVVELYREKILAHEERLQRLEAWNPHGIYEKGMEPQVVVDRAFLSHWSNALSILQTEHKKMMETQDRTLDRLSAAERRLEKLLKIAVEEGKWKG